MKAYKLSNKDSLYNIYIKIIVVIIVSLSAGCKKFIEVGSPINNINADNVYTNDATAAGVVTGIYQMMSRQNSDEYYGTGLLANIYTGPGLSSDELTLFDMNSLDLRLYYTNDLISTSAPRYWSSIYSTIYSVNSVIEGVEKSTALTPAVKNQLLGEAKFLRAFNFFYLVNLYGDVPLALSTDYAVNLSLSRAPKEQVYSQMIKDLEEAKALLSNEYLQGDALSPYPNGMEERVRPNKSAAMALLSRVYLYMKDYANAEMAATEVINNVSLYNLTTLDNAFLKNNREAIWQLQPVDNGINANTGEGKLFILPTTGPGTSNPVYLSKELVSSFEIGDQRKSYWIGHVIVGNTTYYYPFKYKIGAINAENKEYSTIFRLAELYLIRAEARTQQNNLGAAAEDLNAVRRRAGLPNTTATTQTNLLSAIYHERRVELFTEWGHRWLDLKRTGAVDVVLAEVKGANWQATDRLYPIPQEEILKSPNLKGHQNPGY